MNGNSKNNTLGLKKGLFLKISGQKASKKKLKIG
jgi:hypothetical protein